MVSTEMDFEVSQKTEELEEGMGAEGLGQIYRSLESVIFYILVLFLNPLEISTTWPSHGRDLRTFVDILYFA